MRWDKIADDMNPSNANDAWWAGYEAFFDGVTDNPYRISSSKGKDVPSFWFWSAGWWYNALKGE